MGSRCLHDTSTKPFKQPGYSRVIFTPSRKLRELMKDTSSNGVGRRHSSVSRLKNSDERPGLDLRRLKQASLWRPKILE